MSKDIRSNYTKLHTIAFGGASTQALQGHPTEVL